MDWKGCIATIALPDPDFVLQNAGWLILNIIDVKG
jgi:hypothetical protein